MPPLSTPLFVPDLLISDGPDTAIAHLVAGLQVPTLPMPARTHAVRWISLALAGQHVGTLHLVAHGRPGALWLGGQWLDAAALSREAELLAGWRVDRIALWGCAVGVASPLVQLLQRLTGAEVLASDEALGRLDGRTQWLLHGGAGADTSSVLDGHRLFGQQRAETWAHQLGYLTVSFAGGFAGDNGGTNSTNYTYSFNALGWSNAQFAQNSSSNIFTAQGNDIIGSVLLTDHAGVEYEISGFVKWRTPSGGSPSTLVFQPDSAVHLNLQTNPGGAYGGGTFTIDNAYYIGLTFNGRTLSFNEGDPVNGNAATSGLLDVLNNYLAAQPQLSVNDVTVSEGAGTATFTVTLSASSADTVTVRYDTSGGTATAGSDYTAVTGGTLTFSPGQTSKTITVNLTDDGTTESAETFNVVLRDPTFSAISDATGVGTINDNDATPGFVTTAASGPTTEAGGSATFTVRLAAAPSATVTVTVGSDDSTEGTVGPTTLTFTTADWATPQTVTVTGVDDAAVDGHMAYAATLTAASADAGYQGLTGSVAVTNNDNDSAGLVLGSISRHTTEGGQTATFTVALSSQPTGNVTVNVASSDTTEGTVGPSTLTFTAANWATPQTVTLTGVDDAAVDGHVAYAAQLSSSSGDPAYNGLSGSVAVTNDDDDSAGLVAGSISRHTTEAGQTATFTVALSSQPAADVNVAVASNDSTEGAVSLSTLTFTAANWATPQTVTVTGVDDAMVDGQQAYGVTLSATSADSAYQGRTGTVAVVNDDDDSASLVAGAISRHTTEAGQTASFPLRLGSQPAADVTVTVASSDTTEGTVGGSTLTFTPANWNSVQTVTVTGADDPQIDGAVAYAVNLSAASADGSYQGLTGSVAVTNDDNDSASLVLGTATRHTTEGGQTASFTVALGAQPAANVTVAVTSSDTTEGTLAASTLVFTPANWSTPQTVVATGVDDDGVDGAVPYLAQLASTSADTAFNGLTGSVGLVNDDNDSAGLRLSQVSLRTSEDGGASPLGVALASRPVANVTVTVRSTDAQEGMAGPLTLSFTPANWSTLQTVNVYGVDDTRVDGDQPYFVTFEATSADTNFQGASGAVAVVNADNDRARLVVSAGTLATGEDGRSDSFSVRLSSQPLGPVTVSVGSSATGEAQVQATTLSFDTSNWNQAQTVVVQGVDDPTVDGAQPFVVSLAGVSADPAYNGQQASVGGSNADNDQAALVFSADALRTREDGSSASFTVRLSSAPTASVTLTLDTSLASEGRLDGSRLVFTPDDWQTPRTVTVSGVDDTRLDGTVRHAVQVSSASADPAYNGLARSVTVDNEDNDSASLVLDRADLRTGEDGRSDTVGLRLSNRPSQPVTVSVGSSRDSEGRVLTQTLVFTPDNWDQAQPLRVQGVDDPVVDGEQAYRIQLLSRSADPAFAGLQAQLDAHNTDDDRAGLQLQVAADLQTAEDGSTASFSLRLSSRPTAPVTVALHSSDSSEGLPAQQSLVFTPDNWDQARSVVVTGVDDRLVDGRVPYALRLDAQSADPAYNGRTAQVALSNADDDVASNDTQPGFGVDADVQAGDTARLTDPAGHVVASTVLTPEQVQQGNIVITPPTLDDGSYTFMAQVLGPDGELRSERPVTVTIVTDRDGVQPTVEQAAHGGDGNHDGIPDWQQNNVTQLPLRSVADFQAGALAAPASFGVVLAGSPGAQGQVQLDPQAQLQDTQLQASATGLPAGLLGGAPVLRVTLTSQAGQTWRDVDTDRPGHQGEVVIELPFGLDSNSVLLWDGTSSNWMQVLGRGFSAPGSLARLDDSDHDGRPDRLILRVTDGGPGDADGLADGNLQLAITVAQQPAKPVLSVRLPGGDRLLTQDPVQAAVWAQGDDHVFEGAWFDALTPAEGGVLFKPWYQPITQDRTWAADGQALPYACYELQDSAGFLAALPDSGVGSAVHRYLDASGHTQLLTPAAATSLGLAAQGYRDLGAVLRTTTESAFVFDPEAYLVVNRNQASVQQLVAQLAQRFTSTAAPGFVDAVEQHYLAQVALVGLPHGDSADAAAVNTAFGTHFGA